MKLVAQLNSFADRRFRAVVQTFTGLAAWVFERRIVWFGVATLMVAAGYFGYYLFIKKYWLADFYIQLSVLDAMPAGISPYDLKYHIDHNPTFLRELGLQPFSYPYPPVVAKVFYAVMSSTAGRVVFIIAHIISCIVIPYLLAGSPRRWYSRELLFLWGLYLILFGFAGARLFIIGNPSAVLNALIVATLVSAVRTSNYQAFWLACVICANVKIYYVVFLAFPMILDRKYVEAVAVAFLVALTVSINYWLEPTLTEEYLAHLGSMSRRPEMAGWSIYSLFVKGLNQVSGIAPKVVSLLALAAHMVLVGFILILGFAVGLRYDRPRRFDSFCCWLIVSCLLVSPRFFEYDLAIIAVPIVLLAMMLVAEGGVGLVVTVALAGCGLALARTQISDWSVMFAIMAVWLGAAVHWLAAPRGNEKPAPSKVSTTSAP